MMEQPSPSSLIPPAPPAVATHWVNKIGRRGAILFVLGTMDLFYGSALLWAAYTNSGAAWWPAFQGSLLGISTVFWGWFWIGIGTFLFTGITRRTDRLHFAAAMLIKSLWATGAFFYSLRDITHAGWGVFAIYSGFALVVLICSGWADTKLAIPPDLKRKLLSWHWGR